MAGYPLVPPLGLQFDLFLFYPPEVGATVMLPYGVPFESLSLLYLTLSEVFSPSICTKYLLIFDPAIFYPPEVGATVMPPYGVPFESLLFYILP